MKPIIKKKRKVWYTEDRVFTVHKDYEYCGNCEKHLNEYWWFCPYCGEPIERDQKKESNTDSHSHERVYMY
jgi:rRNA maturation endonuclease Nob1